MTYWRNPEALTRLRWPWRIRGERLFGYWLPFIGFRSVWVDIHTMDPIEDEDGGVRWLDEWDHHDAYHRGEVALARVFSVGWLGRSLNLGLVISHV